MLQFVFGSPMDIRMISMDSHPDSQIYLKHKKIKVFIPN